MPSRSQRSPRERDARSRSVKRIAEEPLLRGSLVVMQRVCGKMGCHCAQGEKHASLYLSIRRGKDRAMIYIPPAMEESVRRWVENGKQVDGWLDIVSEQCLEGLLRQKEQALGRSSKAATKKRRP